MTEEEQNSSDKLVKVKRSSGEIEVMTRAELAKLNKQKYQEHKQGEKLERQRSIAVLVAGVSVFGFVMVGIAWFVSSGGMASDMTQFGPDAASSESSVTQITVAANQVDDNLSSPAVTVTKETTLRAGQGLSLDTDDPASNTVPIAKAVVKPTTKAADPIPVPRPALMAVEYEIETVTLDPLPVPRPALVPAEYEVVAVAVDPIPVPRPAMLKPEYEVVVAAVDPIPAPRPTMSKPENNEVPVARVVAAAVESSQRQVGAGTASRSAQTASSVSAEVKTDVVSRTSVSTTADTTRQTVPGIRAAILRWAECWSAKDVNCYLDAYSVGYRPRSGISLEAWKVQRRGRLSRPGAIEIGVGDITVTSGEPGVQIARFIQTYQSPTYRDQVRKKLLLRLYDGEWKITEEEFVVIP